MEKIGGSSLYRSIMMQTDKKYCYCIGIGDNHEVVTGEITNQKRRFYQIPLLRGIYLRAELKKCSQTFNDQFTNTLAKQMVKKLEKLNSEIILETKKYKWLTFETEYHISKLVIIWEHITLFLFPLLLCHFNAHTFSRIFNIMSVLGILLPTLLVISMRKTHAAEHKAINCYLCGYDITMENIKNSSRFSPQCGGNYLMIVTLFGMIVSWLCAKWIPDFKLFLLAILIMINIRDAICYEIFRILIKNKYNPLNIPGYLLQLLTTKKPTDVELEVAYKVIKALTIEEKA